MSLCHNIVDAVKVNTNDGDFLVRLKNMHADFYGELWVAIFFMRVLKEFQLALEAQSSQMVVLVSF